MTEYEKQFLFLMKSYINNEKLPDGYHFDIGRVFSLAAIHNVMPFVYSVLSDSSYDISHYKSKIYQSVAVQMIKNNKLKFYYDKIVSLGIDVFIVKGPVCSQTYPEPEYRLSSDFDFIVNESDRLSLHNYLLSEGFVCNGDNYTDESSGLYIEVSTSLGEGTDVLKEAADAVFEGFESRGIIIDGFRTLSHTDHLVYLIYHAFKHFIGSGFGIRQIIDILLYIKKYNTYIDAEMCKNMLTEIGAYSFACNVFSLIENVFCFCFESFDIDCDDSYICTDSFLDDLLSAGVFGKSSEDRLHSAALVLSAVSDNGNSSIFSVVFPSYKTMKSKFPVLEKYPFLLPVYWIYRLVVYLFRTFIGEKSVSPVRSIDIAESRIELMKKMGIIK